MQDNAKYNSEQPGIGIPAGEWLARANPILVGADNWGIEVRPHALCSPNTQLSPLDTHGNVEGEFEIGCRFAQAELLLLEGQVRLAVLVEAESNAKPYRPRQQRIAPPLPGRSGPWQWHELARRPQDHIGPLLRDTAVDLDALADGLQVVPVVERLLGLGVCSWNVMPNFMTASPFFKRTSVLKPRIAWARTCATYPSNWISCQPATFGL